jgi:glycosyltransferase involved in cell wall biosynthesis
MMKNNFIDEFGIKNITRCHIIHNGFNNKKEISPLYLENSKIHIIYAGEIYGERKITLFAKPLLTLLNKRIINQDNFCFHIFGKLKDHDKKVIQDYQLSGIIKEHPILPYSEILRYLKAADLLILIVSNKMSYSISYKFFDYLSVRKPILSIAPENSAMADLMNKIDCGRWASINSEESILENLEKMLLEKKEYSFSGAEDYTWEQAGQKYLEAIDEVIAS